MVKIRGIPPKCPIPLDKVTTLNSVVLEDGRVCDVIHLGVDNISIAVQGYGTAQYYVTNGAHMFDKLPRIVGVK